MPEPNSQEAAAPEAPQQSPAAEAPRQTGPSTPRQDGAAAGPAQGPRELREAYEGLKAKHEAYAKLGDPEAVGQRVQVAQRISDEAARLGEALGYAPDAIAEAVGADPVEALLFLREQAANAEAARPQDGRDLDAQIQRAVAQQTAPITEHLNRQMTQAAAQRYDAEFDRVLKQSFPDEDLPADVRSVLYDATSELMKYDQEALVRLKMHGQTGDVARHFDAAKTMLLKAINAYSAAQARRTGNGAPSASNGAAHNGAKRPTLDDIINNPGVLNARYS